MRHVLVLADREDAEATAREVVERFAPPSEPEIVRDALAGDDDAEDAQWLVVVDDPAAALSPAALDTIAATHDGWLEHP